MMALTHNPTVVAEAVRQGVSLYHGGERLADRMGEPLHAHYAATLAEIYTADQLRAQITSRRRQIAERRRCLAAKGQCDDALIQRFNGHVRQLQDGLTDRLRLDRFAREQEASHAMAAE